MRWLSRIRRLFERDTARHTIAITIMVVSLIVGMILWVELAAWMLGE